MWKHFFAILTILHVINLSIQQSCKFYCLSDALSDYNCVNENEIKANATINEIEGSVDFQFDFGCKIEFYKIVVFYSKRNCNSANANNAKQHSIYTLKKIRYSNKRYKNKFEKCGQKGKVLLQNIQTGCYYLNIIDKNYNILFENYSNWQTSYKRQEVDVWKTNSTHTSRNNGTELIFTIQNPILNSHPEFSLRFECKNCPKHLSKEHPYNLMQDVTDPSKLILNPKDNNTFLNISCSLEHDAVYGTASCVISPVTVGNYNIIINFIGDPYKCSFNDPKLVRFQNIVVKADELLLQPLTYFASEQIFGPLLAIICILLSCSIVILMIKSTNMDIREFGIKTNYIREHVDDINTISEVDFVETKLLLLYARNSDDVMKTLSSFRNIFIHQGLQVFDIYDPDRLSEINEISFNWILNLTFQKDLKIILILTPSARNFSDLPQVQESVDTLYPFAMKHLLNQISNDSEFEKKIFVCHFSNDLYEYSDFELFSPHLRFRVPDDVLVLLQSILNTTELSLNNKSNIEYKKLKQNYEKHKCFQENFIIHI